MTITVVVLVAWIVVDTVLLGLLTRLARAQHDLIAAQEQRYASAHEHIVAQRQLIRELERG